MKRFFCLLLVLTVLSHTAVEGKPVEKRRAAHIAAKVLGKAVVEATPRCFPECHLFVGDDGVGFVLLAADDLVRPVLAYSLNEEFPLLNTDPSLLDAPSSLLPPNAYSWIDGYCREIASVVSAGVSQSSRVATEWERWSEGIPASKSRTVAPLLSTTWHQIGRYNEHCPYDIYDDSHTVTGCVATAMAQVMRYWEWPEVGYGSHSYTWSYYGTLEANFDTTHYRWDLMPDRLTSSSGSQEVDAVATLMYHAGVSVDMMYGTAVSDGSAAYAYASGGFDFACAENALKTYFRYNPMLVSLQKDAYSEEEWEAMMHAELDAGCPVIYGAVQPRVGGHEFVIDGYDSVGMYHVNWGWGGRCDGWYTIDELAPSDEGISFYCFNGVADALMGVYPHRQPATGPVTVHIVSNDPSLGTVSGSGVYQPYDTVHVQIQSAEGCRYIGMASGRHNIPFDFLAVGDDYTDTALFERVEGDVVGYCQDYYIEDQPYGESGSFEWGIRIPPILHRGRVLSAVKMYLLEDGNYTLSVYQRETPPAGATPLYSKVYSLYGFQDWYSMALDSLLVLDPDLPLWITLSATNNDQWFAPIGGSPYCGNPDGSWYLFPDGWDFYHPIEGYYTWQIRAVLENYVGVGEMDRPTLRVQVTGLDLTVENPDGATLRLYDLSGRLLSTSLAPSSAIHFQLPAPGVYLLQADGYPAQRVVTVR